MIQKIKNNEMNEVKESKVALIDFSATWCGPCKMLEPVLEELSEEMDGEVAFFNADTDENLSLTMGLGVTNIPALFLFKDGEKVAQTVGFQPKEQLKAWIEEQLA